MEIKRRYLIYLAACLTGFLAACAPTDVKMISEHRGKLPAPDRILVYSFAVSPEEVSLDQGMAERLKKLVGGDSPSDEERIVGRVESEALAKNIIAELRAAGLPAERGYGSPQRGENVLMIQGQFLSIDEGNRTKRVVIGLGAGRTKIQTDVQLYETSPTGKILVAEFETDAGSGYKPGMAETFGASAAADRIAAGAAAGGGASVLSEGISADIEADAKRTAEKLVKRLSEYFAYQGWFGRSPAAQ